MATLGTEKKERIYRLLMQTWQTICPCLLQHKNNGMSPTIWHHADRYGFILNISCFDTVTTEGRTLHTYLQHSVSTLCYSHVLPFLNFFFSNTVPYCSLKKNHALHDLLASLKNILIYAWKVFSSNIATFQKYSNDNIIHFHKTSTQLLKMKTK